MKKFLLKLSVFLLIPLLVVEASLHLAGKDWYESHWYQAIEENRTGSEPSVLLIGTSRTAASIDAKQLSQFLSDKLKHSVKVFNLGLGYSTLTEHYFGIKRLIEQRKSLDNVVVLIECTRGFPLMDKWNGPWVHEEVPEMIMPLLNIGEIDKLWHQSSLPLLTKATITLGRYILCIRYFKRCRNAFESSPAKMLFPRLYRKKYDIAEKGGIGANKMAVRLTRQRVKDDFKEGQQKTEPSFELNSGILFCSLVDLCQSKGARVFIYVPPTSSVDTDNLFYTKLATAKTDLSTYCRNKNIALVPVVMKLSDEDFPDLRHLGESRRAECTKLTGSQLWDSIEKQHALR